MPLIEVLRNDELPEWFAYPARLRSVVNQGLADFHPWHLLRPETALVRLKGLSGRFPDVNLLPFARRTDGDEIARFLESELGSGVVFEDFNQPFRINKRFPSFEDWVRAAIEDMLTFEADSYVWFPLEQRKE
jgi:hypothetical protein